MSIMKSRAVRKFVRDKMAVLALAVICAYSLTALFVGLGGLGLLGAGHDEVLTTEAQEVAFYTEPSAETWKNRLGTDRQGRSILVRAIHSIYVAMSVGLVTAILAVFIGTFLGAIAGYFGGWVDSGIVWLYSTVQSIPYLLLLLVLSYSAGLYFDSKGLITVFVAFGATFWTGPCRVVRGEVMKLREADYVAAAHALGAGPWRILFSHVIPNVAHLSFVYFSLVFIGAIKAEVILSYLGFGAQNQPSWGTMINQARSGMAIDFYWQIGAATAFMFVLVLAFNVFTDALQDALDPKSV